MTTGSDNLGNGAAKTEDRFAGQLGYRPRGNREGTGTRADTGRGGNQRGGGSPLGGGALNGGALNSGALLGGPGPIGTHGGGTLSNPLSGDPLDAGLGSSLHIENPIASTLTEPTLPDPDPVESDLSFRDAVGLASTDCWLGTTGKGVADHPLLRGLLLELPPKGATLQVQWLDRWFEAARSILELLYRFEDKRD